MKFNIKEIAIKAGGISAGAIVAKFANRMLPDMNPKLRAGIKIGLGAVIPELMPKQKIVAHVGAGILAIGAAELFEEFVPTAVSGADDIMNGIGEGGIAIDEDYENDSLSGADDIMNGVDDDDEIAGSDDDDDL